MSTLPASGAVAIKELKDEGRLRRRCRVRQCKYLNNIIEQDHRTAKRRAWLAMGYGSFRSAWRTLQGIEAVNMIRKGRVRWVAKEDPVGQVRFVGTLFGVAACKKGQSQTNRRPIFFLEFSQHNLVKDMADSAAEMLEAAGAKNVRKTAHPSSPGWAIHEVGIARMGNDPQKSVLNQFKQTHDVKNVFVCDGSGFTSTACQNPTLTIMTLCVRSMDYLMGEMKRGNV
jgi:hypothetical protein